MPVCEPSLIVAVVFDMPGNIEDGFPESEDELRPALVHHVTVKRFLCHFSVKNYYFFRSDDTLFPASYLEVGVVLLNTVSQLVHYQSAYLSGENSVGHLLGHR